MKAGIWVWGGATAILGTAIVLVVATGWPCEVLVRIQNTETVLAGVIAASALGWSIFFQTADRAEETAKIKELVERVEFLIKSNARSEATPKSAEQAAEPDRA